MRRAALGPAFCSAAAAPLAEKDGRKVDSQRPGDPAQLAATHGRPFKTAAQIIVFGGLGLGHEICFLG